MPDIEQTIAEVLRLDAEATGKETWSARMVCPSEGWSDDDADPVGPDGWLVDGPEWLDYAEASFLHCVDAELVAYYRTAAPALAREVKDLRERHLLTLQERDRARFTADQRIFVREELAALLGTDDVEQAVAEVKRLKAEVERLQDEVERLRDAAYRAGQEAMMARCRDAVGSLPDYPACCTCSHDRRRSRSHSDPHCEGWQDAMDRAESALRGLEVE